MRRVLIQDNFYKSVPIEKRKKVENLCKEIERQLNSSNSGIFGTYLAAQSKKFRGRKHLFKFRASDGDRIMFTYTNYLKNYRGQQDSELYLIEYIPQHDQQNRRARSFNEKVSRKIDDRDCSDEIVLDIEEAEDKEYEEYEKYFDLDNTITYIKNENEISNLFSQDDELLEVYISNKQFEYVCEKKSTVLLGGAGSGKTLVCLHKLVSYQGYEGKKGYFTYSEGLKNKSEKMFNRISQQSNKVSFYTFESFCLKFLGLREDQFVDFFWFKKNFELIKGSIELPAGVGALDVWSEIRGIIKGYMWSKWNRNFPMSFKLINGISRNVLQNKYGYIKAYKGDERQIICQDTSETAKSEIIKTLQEDLDISYENKKVILEDLKKIYNMSTAFHYGSTEGGIDKRILPLEEYLDLSSDISIYKKEERESLHALAVNYQKYKDKNNLYDDNDFAGLSLIELRKQDNKPFDFIVVDEVQDLTELQLYFMYNLVEDKNNVFFAGDIHQIINPTYFSPARLKSLFSFDNKVLKERYLNKNYRSQQYIVELANRLSDIRGRYIAKKALESEEIVYAINEGQPLLYLEKSVHNLKQMLLAINEKANAAVIVADSEDRVYLEGILGSESNNIYTVTEIKGLEFDYIFCYNLASKYSDCWEDIFSGKARKNARYRYYFNIFYVSITRARKYLCVYNEEENKLFSSNIAELFESVWEYNEELLYLEGDDKNPLYWEHKGRELEEAEIYDKAILAYKKAKSDRKDIIRCEAKVKAKEKNYDSAIKMMLSIGEYKYARKYAEDSGNKSMTILASILAEDVDFMQLEEQYGKEAVIEVVAGNLLNEDYGDLINVNYLENYILLNMLEDIDKINKCIT
jgi:superfamily I DNA/RNA helicase